MLLAAAPAFYVALTWARLIDERHLRIERPLLALSGGALDHRCRSAAARALAAAGRRCGARSPSSSIMASALGAGLATIGLELGKSLDHLAVIIALDRSRSIELVPSAERASSGAAGRRKLGMREDDRIGTIAFAAEAAIEDPPRPRTRMLARRRKPSSAVTAPTSAAAIRRALAEVPAGRGRAHRPDHRRRRYPRQSAGCSRRRGRSGRSRRCRFRSTRRALTDVRVVARPHAAPRLRRRGAGASHRDAIERCPRSSRSEFTATAS